MCPGQGRGASHGVRRMSCGLLGSLPLLQPGWMRASGEIGGGGGGGTAGERSGNKEIDFRMGGGGAVYL